MNLKNYISILIVLLLVAAPWMQASASNTGPSEPECQCCQGPCQGCCCGDPLHDDTQDSEQPRQTDDGCTCSFSAIPSMPESPVEFTQQRVDKQTSKTLSQTETRSEPNFDTSRNSLYEFYSPPAERSRPAYILFASYLI